MRQNKRTNKSYAEMPFHRILLRIVYNVKNTGTGYTLYKSMSNVFA